MPAGRRENTKNPGMAETDKKNQDGAFFKNLSPGGVYKKKTRGIPDRPAANAAAPLQISSPHGGRSSPQKINGGRQSNGRLAPRLVVCVVHLILNGTKEGSAQCHTTSRRTQSQAGGFSC